MKGVNNVNCNRSWKNMKLVKAIFSLWNVKQQYTPSKDCLDFDTINHCS
jgi:hypothetical protein